jgi:hypothetical protein
MPLMINFQTVDNITTKVKTVTILMLTIKNSSNRGVSYIKVAIEIRLKINMMIDRGKIKDMIVDIRINNMIRGM